MIRGLIPVGESRSLFMDCGLICYWSWTTGKMRGIIVLSLLSMDEDRCQGVCVWEIREISIVSNRITITSQISRQSKLGLISLSFTLIFFFISPIQFITSIGYEPRYVAYLFDAEYGYWFHWW